MYNVLYSLVTRVKGRDSGELKALLNILRERERLCRRLIIRTQPTSHLMVCHESFVLDSTCAWQGRRYSALRMLPKEMFVYSLPTLALQRSSLAGEGIRGGWRSSSRTYGPTFDEALLSFAIYQCVSALFSALSMAPPKREWNAVALRWNNPQWGSLVVWLASF